ncbi:MULTISPECIES: sensor domain-containing phosphodiesterase [unclassified Stenotrophomonas]|uniref:putative bifunctional diguanylate cyclase/phosphodiesterase n=1 Tax=unclassified Stenotrophomonas TaxID=196198 RepID=UPI0020182225|nr:MULTISPECIES: sensor domain-containing phosphodiesterase [unclassified Stenotrophomonas]
MTPMSEELKTQERMAAVGALQVLDAAAGASLDRITQLAAFAFNAPVAFVSIVGTDSQRFISKVGLDIPGTDIRSSVCSYTITAADVLVVPDLRADPRFAGNGLVCGPPHLRFYAGAPLVAKNGVPIGAICVMAREPRELSEDDRQHLKTLAAMAMSQLELRRLSGRQDPVSGLPNRHQFHIDYDGLVSRARGPVHAVLLDVLDVPRLEEAGQALGMPPLEAMIHRSGVRLRVALEDIADIYHVGTSRFVFLVDQPLAEDVETLLLELKQRITRPVMAAAVPMSPQFHAGICTFDPAKDSSNDVLRKLLVSLQAAITGRLDFCWYSERRDELLRRGYRLAADAERGLRREEFYLLFQPRVEAITQKIVSAEALIRWNHPRLGPVGPAEFIPVFERTALMPAVSGWVVDAALDQLATWQLAGLSLSLSVNLAASDLSTEGMAERLLQKLAARDLAPSLLEIEITEGEWLRANTVAGEQLARLAGVGVRIAIDDFGSGYSNFGYLSRLPISTIKMDKSLVDHLADDPGARLKAKAIIELAKGLGYTTVAEGVETAAQRDVLTDLHCDQLQGFLFAAPLSADELATMVGIGG